MGCSIKNFCFCIELRWGVLALAFICSAESFFTLTLHALNYSQDDESTFWCIFWIVMATLELTGAFLTMISAIVRKWMLLQASTWIEALLILTSYGTMLVLEFSESPDWFTIGLTCIGLAFKTYYWVCLFSLYCLEKSRAGL